ncbi:MAG TPA: GMP/IMP nucleotidase [Spongiibacteraceae bacterium]|nr:GMP/IMP nucleotidase [Spongiibacteraceae bacterium]
MHNSAVLIDWEKIDTVLLDMDGTLLDLYFDNHFWLEHLPQRYAQRHVTSPERARAHLTALFAAQRGTLNWYCVDYWSRELQLDIAELKREVEHLIGIRPYVEEFLQRLHASPRQVWLVTNAHRKSLDIKMQRTGIDRWFDRIVSSHDLSAPKEAAEFWRHLRESHPFDPARALLIDDTATVLLAAQHFGIAHLLTLLQPDSRQAQRIATEFPGILHFDEIMPPLFSSADMPVPGSPAL